MNDNHQYTQLGWTSDDIKSINIQTINNEQKLVVTTYGGQQFITNCNIASETVAGTVKAIPATTEFNQNIAIDSAGQLKTFAAIANVTSLPETIDYTKPRVLYNIYDKEHDTYSLAIRKFAHKLAAPKCEFTSKTNILKINKVPNAASYKILVNKIYIGDVAASAEDVILSDLNSFIKWADIPSEQISIEIIAQNSVDKDSDPTLIDTVKYNMLNTPEHFQFIATTIHWNPVINAEKYEVKIDGMFTAYVTKPEIDLVVFDEWAAIKEGETLSVTIQAIASNYVDSSILIGEITKHTAVKDSKLPELSLRLPAGVGAYGQTEVRVLRTWGNPSKVDIRLRGKVSREMDIGTKRYEISFE